jgi:hypothetical protein
VRVLHASCWLLAALTPRTCPLAPTGTIDVTITNSTTRQHVTTLPRLLDYDLNHPSQEANPTAGQLYGREDRAEEPSVFEGDLLNQCTATVLPGCHCTDRMPMYCHCTDLVPMYCHCTAWMPLH